MVGEHRAAVRAHRELCAIGLSREDFDPIEDFFHDVPAAVRDEALRQPEPQQSDTPFDRPWPLHNWPDVPTRVIAGSDDRLFPLEFSAELCANGSAWRWT
ncbi:MAG: hypothetical protein ACXWD8_16020 [Mycobacterium sp.]